MRILRGPYLSDLLAQPGAVRDTVEGLRSRELAQGVAEVAQDRDCRRIILTGMGSSYHALHPLLLRLVERKRPVDMIETSELIHYRRRLLDAGSLLVAVSQSGESAEIVRLIKVANRRCRIIGVTNSPDSTLARKADVAVPLHAGSEASVSCKTYVATLAALAWLGEIFCGRRPGTTLSAIRAAADAMEEYLGQWKAHVDALAAVLKPARNLFYAGRGPSLAAAGTAGLTTKEAAHFHAEGLSAAAYRHGPFEMTGPGVLVLVFQGPPATSGLNQSLVDAVRSAGGQAELIGEDGRGPFRLPQQPEAARPLLEILPVQMVTLALAGLAGREAGRFERATKVTTVE